jgi:hypothetical protein
VAFASDKLRNWSKRYGSYPFVAYSAGRLITSSPHG